MNRKNFEEDIYRFWEEKKIFSTNLLSKKKSFGLLIPPPNLTGELHLGHALQHSILDAVARFKRLEGYEVLLLPGVDHAGIQFEGTFDKHLQKQNLSKGKLGREEWLKKAWEFKEDIYKSVSKSWRLMGISADWSREVFTLDSSAQKAVFFQFKTFFEKGLIYKGPYIVQWCPKCNTAIEDVEMEYEERDEKLYFIRYLVEKSEGEFIEIATTRPETIFADSGIAIYPNHKKFKEFVGKNAHLPLPNVKGRLIQIFEDKRVEKAFGTGALKITPGHDILDFEIGKDHGLPVYLVIGKNGRLAGNVGSFAGLSVNEARKKAVEILKENNALVGEKNYKHSVAVCERCKTVVEPLISEEWFVKVGHLSKGAEKAIKKGAIQFLPTSYGKVIAEWLGNIHDWCISRSLWWGHRIPVWYPSTRSARSGQVAEMRVSLESPGEGWLQDEQVLDTWFSSGIWPLITLGWPFGMNPQAKPSVKKAGFEPGLAKYYPWDFEISAPEIKFLWIARMIMLGVHFTGKAPFKKMFFHGTLRDLQGRKFSKSLGNGIDPVYLIEKWGVDATRMALFTYSVPGRDGRVSKEILDERSKNFRNFVTKIRNISRFVIDLAPDDAESELKFEHRDDLQIINELEMLATKVTNNLESLNLHLATDDLYNFTWHHFADVYMEKSKKRRAEAQPVLEYVLRNVLILLHPFMPFVTEEQYQKLESRKESIMLETWPL